MSSEPPKRPMSLQARMNEHDPRLYNVNRDVAHNFKRVAEMVAGRLEDRLWPELADLLDEHGITMDDLGAACQAYCTFIGSEAEDPHESVEECMDRAGWFKVKPEAQIAYMALVGTIISGMQFSGVREATLGGDGPAATLKEVLAAGERTARFLAMPRWKRRLMIWRNRLSRAWRTLRHGT